MCESRDDCTGSQICDVGVCWGEPPDTTGFSAILIPPADRPDLAPTELANIEIDSKGTISGLQFGKSILLHGRVEISCEVVDKLSPCSELVPAQIIIERSSSFRGGPKFTRTISTNTAVDEDQDSFQVRLPDDGAEYQVTVLPDDLYLGSLSSGGSRVQAPPYSATIKTAGEDILVEWEVGRPDELKTIAGCVTNALGNGTSFEAMQVSALGRWGAQATPTRASSVVPTNSEGCFELTVPIGMLNRFDIVVRPNPDQVLPTLRILDVDVPDPTDNVPAPITRIAPLLMPNAAIPASFKLPLIGLSTGGAVAPVAGATIVVTTIFPKSASELRDVEVRFVAQAVSSDLSAAEPGVVLLQLYPGNFDDNREYQVQVISQPGSEFASIFAAEMEVGTGDGAPVLAPLSLARRVLVTGSLVTESGEALANTPITIRPSPRLRQDLSKASERAVLDNLQFSSELSGENGDFSFFLDRELLGRAARYDLDLAPPDFSSAPRWTFSNLAVDTEELGDAISFGELRLPGASYARGTVRDGDGEPVPGAEIRWYRDPGPDVCMVPPPGQSCVLPATLLGIWGSDETGETFAVLPQQ